MSEDQGKRPVQYRATHCMSPAMGMVALEKLQLPHLRRRHGTKSRGRRSAAYRAIKRDWKRDCPLREFARRHPEGAEWFANKKRSEQ